MKSTNDESVKGGLMNEATRTRRRCRKWRAKWIWSDVKEAETNVYYYFRKTFDVSNDGNGYRLFVAADTRYQLFLNGTFVGRGAPQSQPFYQYYDSYDLDDFGLEKSNCLALIVNHVGNIADTRGGLLLEVVDAEGNTVVGTDDSWRVSRSVAWERHTYKCGSNKATPYQEVFDARREPVGWRNLDFDDGSWNLATILSGRRSSDRPPSVPPWTRLVPRDIPFMTADPVFPVRIERVEESLDIVNRPRAEDLSPGLSQVGQPIEHSRFDGVEALLGEKGAAIVQSSVKHLDDLDFDGVYAPAVVLDFGRIVTARTRLRLSGAAGGMVDVGYVERLIDGRFNNALECEFADRYVMKDGEQTFESFMWRSFRYMKLRFRSCFEPVTLHVVQGVVSTYPFEDRGKFSSGDEVLNAVFDISRNTVRLCSNEFIMDTPWREQAQWLGDVALVSVPAIHSCFGDAALPRKFFMQAGQNQHQTGMISNISNMVSHSWGGVIPDYSLHWIWGIWTQYMHTGDEELVHRLYPQCLRILDAHLDYLNDDGLVEDMPYWVFIDWADVEKRGVCGPYNAIFHVALKTLRRLAEFRDDAHAKRLVDEVSTGIQANFHRTLFDEDRGCYADASVDGVLSEKISEQGNMAPIWAGLCDRELGRSLVSTVFESDRTDSFTEAQPFFMAVVLAALDDVGRFDLALDLIRRRWGNRMVAKGATSTYEEWYQNGSWRNGPFLGFLRSNSHAWSACPADFLIRRLIGLEILKPGCAEIRLNPRETDFDYHVAFPGPKGTVTVKCVDGETTIDVDGAIDVVDNG